MNSAIAIALATAFAVTGCLATFQAADAQVRSQLTTRDYLVRGDTARGVVESMKNAPLQGDRGAAIASIVPEFELKFRTVETGDACRVTEASMNVRFTLTLPRARDEARMASATRTAWRGFLSFAKQHEEEHRRIYLGCADRIVREVRRMSESTCDALSAAVARAQQRELAACEQRQDSLDRRDYRRLPRLPLFRMGN